MLNINNNNQAYMIIKDLIQNKKNKYIDNNILFFTHHELKKIIIEYDKDKKIVLKYYNDKYEYNIFLKKYKLSPKRLPDKNPDDTINELLEMWLLPIIIRKRIHLEKINTIRYRYKWKGKKREISIFLYGNEIIISYNYNR
jgi:hypothetical protein